MWSSVKGGKGKQHTELAFSIIHNKLLTEMRKLIILALETRTRHIFQVQQISLTFCFVKTFFFVALFFNCNRKKNKQIKKKEKRGWWNPAKERNVGDFFYGLQKTYHRPVIWPRKKIPSANTSPIDKAGCSAAVFLIKRRNPTPMTVSPDRLLVLFNVTWEHQPEFPSPQS